MYRTSGTRVTRTDMRERPIHEEKGDRLSKTILEMQHITKTFPGVKALDDVNLVVEETEIHALCGENGAGK